MVLISQAVLQGIMMGALYGLFASGLTMSFAVSRILNFAYGDFMVLAMYACLTLYSFFHLDPYQATIIVVPFLFGVGWLVYKLFLKRVLNVHIVMVLQLTLGIVFLLENSYLMIFKGDPVKVPTFLSYGRLIFGPYSITMPLVVSLVVAGGCTLALRWLLHSTGWGRSIRAVFQDPVAAQLMGVDIEMVRGTVYGISLALAALAGICAGPIMILEPYMGFHLTLVAFIIVTLGGLGSFTGAIIGGLIVGVAEAIGAVIFSSGLAMVFVFLAFILILLIKPEGLLGERISVVVR